MADKDPLSPRSGVDESQSVLDTGIQMWMPILSISLGVLIFGLMVFAGLGSHGHPFQLHASAPQAVSTESGSAAAK